MKKITLLIIVTLLSTKIYSQGSWVQQDLLTNGYDVNNWVQFVDAVDSNVCWGLSASRNGQSNPVQNFVRTVDGGITWTNGAITNATNCAPSSIMALNADTAWVVMFDLAGGGKILRTSDGGVTWTHQNTATFAAPAGFPNIVHFFDASNGICMGDPNGGYFEIYTTGNGGTNWVRVPQANIPANNAGEFGVTDVYSASGTTNLWFGTNFGRIYKTNDAGATWTVASTPYTGFIGGMTFKDANNGLACEADVNTTATDLIYTNDGGATWNTLNCITGNVGQKQSVIYVPGTDSSYVFTSPYNRTAAPIRSFGSGISTNNGNDWYMVSENLEVFSDNDFASVNGGWAGGLTQLDPFFGLFRDPVMFKWTGPIYVPLNEVQPLSFEMDVVMPISTISPVVTFKNNSLYKGSFNVTLTAVGGYSSTKTVTIPNAQATAQVTFDPWTPATVGNYILTATSQLVNDEDTTNDVLTLNVQVLNELQNYGWLSLGPISTPSFGLSSAFYYDGIYPNGNGYLYAFGGANGAVANTNSVFDLTSSQWLLQTPMDSVRYQFSTHTVNGKIYAISGYKGGFTPESTTGIYDIANDSWSNGTDIPAPVGDYASGVYNDSLIYVIGGYDGTGDVNTVQVYDVVNDTWNAATPKPGTATAGLRGGISGNKIVVVGGYSQTGGSAISDAYMGTINPSNPLQITWAPINDYPAQTASRLGAGVPYSQAYPVIVFTGGDPTGLGVTALKYTLAYDVNAGEWLIAPNKPTPVSNISDFVGAVYNDSLYVASVSGYDGTGISSVNEWLNIGSATILKVNSINNSNESLLVYPNPSSSLVTVKIPSVKNYTVEIFNSIGEKVLERNIQNKFNEQFNLTEYRKGIYHVRVYNEKENYSAKVVME